MSVVTGQYVLTKKSSNRHNMAFMQKSKNTKYQNKSKILFIVELNDMLIF